jgi:hypothetical protein
MLAAVNTAPRRLCAGRRPVLGGAAQIAPQSRCPGDEGIMQIRAVSA